jgi:hypothetical protein
MRLAIVTMVLALLSVAARADDDSESRARAHYEVGVGLYKLGDFQGALKEFAAGYALTHKPGFLVNVGQTYRKLGDLAKARASYQQFLVEAQAGDPKRPQVESLLAEIDEQIRLHPQPDSPPPVAPSSPAPAPTAASPPASAQPTVTLTPPPPRDRRGLRIAGLTIGSVGVALIGGGIGFAFIADSNARDLNALDRAGGVFDSGKDSAYTTDRALEATFFAVGAAATATGVVLYVVGRRR